MIISDKYGMLTVGELKKELEFVADSTPVFIEKVSEETYWKQGFEKAILPCDENQFDCKAWKKRGEWACEHCKFRHTYSDASRVVQADGVIYIDSTI